ncbi:L-aspartate oxidase [Limihaloglobus sulfuriphilus]|uniref:L-aspartate oxidase n=1 Tax=Limihaloglobus sulfuriphilus TaxID=1851148 RepID=A0A1Q2MD74_9BACT|nr:L-aspartate oxidase [Limihaloglobus sulfuriphilus]AQQ70645.1 L-aspartate oxidase [Limihaloglobus sulfuriphilus]
MQPEIRRYLTNIDTVSTQQFFTDVLVVGAGVSGLRAAIEASEKCSVTLVCKDTLEKSNSWLAQGGIASVLDKDDSLESHYEDTIRTGCGLCNNETVRLVVQNGPKLVHELKDWGTEFDMVGDKFAATLEGGHSFARIAHSHGDSTGRGITEALIRKARGIKNINIIEEFFTIDLITDQDKNCLGIIGYNSKLGTEIIWGGSTILATGGAGRLYRETTNPRVATADGLAMAYRAGAVLADLEMMQFHPTTLYIAGASRALITEALRGEGAILIDCNGDRFMSDYNPAGELAPRDIVSQSILSQMLKTNSTHVYLDVRHFKEGFFQKRFPYIYELCKDFDIDVRKDLIPVRPSAHYMIGGIKTDLQARTNIKGLFAVGEAAATGLHGANRLASNSLVEGLVFGQIAGKNAASDIDSAGIEAKRTRVNYHVPVSQRTVLDTADVRNSLRALMWRNIGITRHEKALQEAREIILFWQRYVMDKVFDDYEGWECQNMLTVAMLMAESAQKRKESRGVHYRRDYPEKKEDFAFHIETCMV